MTESLHETDLIRVHYNCLVLVCQKLSRPVKVRLQSFEYLTLPIIFDQRRLTSPTQLSPALLREAKLDHQLRVSVNYWTVTESLRETDLIRVLSKCLV